MKLTNHLKGRLVKKGNWAIDEFEKILFVGMDFYIYRDQTGKEMVGVVDRSAKDWEFAVPSKPLPDDMDDEDDEEDDEDE